MYCPRCGQQQISYEMRFCSRCGLPMGGLAEWLAGSGAPVRYEQAIPVASRSPRRKGIRRAAKLMFLSAVLFPVFLVISLIIDEGGPMMIPVTIFFVALVWMLYSRLFGETTPPIKNQQVQASAFGALGAMSGGNVLPPPSNVGMHGPGIPGRRVRTAELAQPPSVTENTTRLLDEE